MRRVPLALALIGAVAAAGCGGSSRNSSNDTGEAKGVSDGKFWVSVQNGQNLIDGTAQNAGATALKMAGGYITSSPSGINCGDGAPEPQVCDYQFTFGDAVTLIANPKDGTTNKVIAWGGDCISSYDVQYAINQTCLLNSGATAANPAKAVSDQYVVAVFGSAVNGHPNFSSGESHQGIPDASTGNSCRTCHGGELQGVGIAIGCGSCHVMARTAGVVSPLPTPTGTFAIPANPTVGSLNFTFTATDSTADISCPLSLRSSPNGPGEIGIYSGPSGVAGATGFTAGVAGTYVIQALCTFTRPETVSNGVTTTYLPYQTTKAFEVQVVVGP